LRPGRGHCTHLQLHQGPVEHHHVVVDGQEEGVCAAALGMLEAFQDPRGSKPLRECVCVSDGRWIHTRYVTLHFTSQHAPYSYLH
jgi:hypothetical protein